MTKKAWLAFAMMSVLWGIPYFLIRIVVRTVEPGTLVFLRTAPAAVFLGLLALRGSIPPRWWKSAPWIVLFGFVEFGVPWFCMSRAEQHVSSSLTSLMIASVPLMSLVLHKLRRGAAPISRRRYLGMSCGFFGVLALVGFDVHGSSLAWIGLLVVTCLGYSIGPIIMDIHFRDIPGPLAFSCATGVVALAWMPYGLTHLPTQATTETWLAVAALSLFCTAAAFLIFNELIKEAGPSRAVVVTYPNTTLAVIIGIVGLHEPLTIGMLVGFPLVMLGSYWATDGAVRT